jgi:hypothetical protein
MLLLIVPAIVLLPMVEIPKRADSSQIKQITAIFFCGFIFFLFNSRIAP